MKTKDILRRCLFIAIALGTSMYVGSAKEIQVGTTDYEDVIDWNPATIYHRFPTKESYAEYAKNIRRIRTEHTFADSDLDFFGAIDGSMFGGGNLTIHFIDKRRAYDPNVQVIVPHYVQDVTDSWEIGRENAETERRHEARRREVEAINRENERRYQAELNRIIELERLSGKRLERPTPPTRIEVGNAAYKAFGRHMAGSFVGMPKFRLNQYFGKMVSMPITPPSGVYSTREDELDIRDAEATKQIKGVADAVVDTDVANYKQFRTIGLGIAGDTVASDSTTHSEHWNPTSTAGVLLDEQTLRIIGDESGYVTTNAHGNTIDLTIRTSSVEAVSQGDTVHFQTAGPYLARGFNIADMMNTLGWTAKSGAEQNGVLDDESRGPILFNVGSRIQFAGSQNMKSVLRSAPGNDTSPNTNTLTYSVSSTLAGLDRATLGESAVQVDTQGVTIGANGPYLLAENGVYNNDQRIQAVQDGTEDHHGVTVNQLKQAYTVSGANAAQVESVRSQDGLSQTVTVTVDTTAIRPIIEREVSRVTAESSLLEDRGSEVASQVHHVEQQLERIGSKAAALSALQVATYDPNGRTQVLGGEGQYEGRRSTAIGLAHYGAESWMMHGGATMGTGQSMMNAGMTMQLGATSKNRLLQEGPISAIAKLEAAIEDLEMRNQALRTQQAANEALLVELENMVDHQAAH